MEKHVAIIHKHGQLFTEEGDFPSICVRGPWKQLELSVWSQRVMSAHLQGGAEDKHRQGVWRKGLSESFSERSQGLVFGHCPLIINYLPFQRKYQVFFLWRTTQHQVKLTHHGLISSKSKAFGYIMQCQALFWSRRPERGSIWLINTEGFICEAQGKLRVIKLGKSCAGCQCWGSTLQEVWLSCSKF